MLNHDVCVRKSVNGTVVAETIAGRSGHAVYGPYEPIEAGNHKAVFRVLPVDLEGCAEGAIVATVDVCIDYGRNVVAERRITAGELRSGQTRFAVTFDLSNKAVVEFRIAVVGNARLELDEYSPHGPASEDEANLAFPRIDATSPAILRNHQDQFRFLFERGFRVDIRDADVILQKDGIRFFAHDRDDLNLVEEIFLEQVYRFERTQPTVLIDIGMNIGLVAMQFSRNAAVEKVYSFEPFPATYDRAMANFSLNPDLAGKIVASNTGVSDVGGKLTINVHETAVSGSQSTLEAGYDGGISMQLDMQVASDVLRQVRVRHPQSDIIVKVDCEGSEFGILADLASSGLLADVRAFMVEWHNVFPGKNQGDLIAPLRDAGFTVIDRSPKIGNGFFYAVR